jgi:hypothetical protein
MSYTLAFALLVNVPGNQAPLGTVNLSDFADLEYHSNLTIDERTCFGADKPSSKRWFDNKFGPRIAFINTYFRGQFTTSQLESAFADTYGIGFVYVGGCPPDRRHRAEANLRVLLSRLESRIR